MVNEKNVSYITNSEKEETFKKLYEEFTSQYSINVNTGGLIIVDSFDEKGIQISPEEIKGKVLDISALKPALGLDIKLIKNDLLSHFSIFKTKNDKTIVVLHK